MKSLIALVALTLVFTAPAPTAQTAAFLHQSNLVYQGAFRMPASNNEHTLYGGRSIAFDPATKTLILAGQNTKFIGEITVPTPVIATTIAGLPRASWVHPWVDPLGALRKTIMPKNATGETTGGLLPLGNKVAIAVYETYDGSNLATGSHFLVDRNLPVAPTAGIVGPLKVRDAALTQDYKSGWNGGPMAPIPPEWQAALGGDTIVGNCCISIIARTSLGPSATIIKAADLLAGKVPVPGTRVLGYPTPHPTLGEWGAGIKGSLEIDPLKRLFSLAVSVTGVVFPPGTRSVLFFGRAGRTVCYGMGTDNPDLDGQPVPGLASADYCFDPLDSDFKGTHGYPYVHFVWAYDANDLVAVKNGAKKYWEIRPYDAWTFDLPFEVSVHRIYGATVDPATNRLFVSAALQDNAAPLIHVFKIQ